MKNQTLLDNVLVEAEKYSFPIIISDDAVARNYEARRAASISHLSPLDMIKEKDRERLIALADGEAVLIRLRSPKKHIALAYRKSGATVFMFLPMLGSVSKIPSESFTFEPDDGSLSSQLSLLAPRLLADREINVSSFMRICSIAASLSFSEDIVRSNIADDGNIDAKASFEAFGRALEQFDSKVGELIEPPIELSFSQSRLSVSLYGSEIWQGRSAALTAVAPYAFTEREYYIAFALSLAISIYKGRK